VAIGPGVAGDADAARPVEGERIDPAEIANGEPTRRASSELTISAAAIGGLLALGALAAALPRRELQIGEKETVLYMGRPRKVLTRYVGTLGLWELVRRSTSYAVTDKRVVVERGLFRRRTHSIPLSAIVDVEVSSGLRQGVVRVSGSGHGGAVSEELGPLRSGAARSLATTIFGAIARR
jgi:hypothetical protein